MFHIIPIKHFETNRKVPHYLAKYTSTSRVLKAYEQKCFGEFAEMKSLLPLDKNGSLHVQYLKIFDVNRVGKLTCSTPYTSIFKAKDSDK